MVRPPFGTNSSVHFPAMIGVDIKGRLQPEIENTDFQILLEYIFFIYKIITLNNYFSEKGVYFT